MSTLALVVLSFLLPFVFVANGSQIGHIEKPEFSYLEKHVLEVKYKISKNTYLFVCWSCNMSDPIIQKMKCRKNKICPDYGEVQHCQSKGHYKICRIDWVGTDIYFEGYVSQRDSKNVTKKSEVATYLSSETTRKPRPVTNLIITPNNTDLILKWTPNVIYTPSARHHQLVSCQPVQDKNAKAFLKVLSDRVHSKLVVHSFNISAAIKYQCCIKVTNVLNSCMSERTCANVTSPEKAPSAPPVIECGNSTNFQCPSKVKGLQRNVTILFKPPLVKERNGHITHHVVTYRNYSGSNSTTVQLTFSNGSATRAKLVGLTTQTKYQVSMKSCNKAGCSPPSNTVEIPKIFKQKINDGSPITKVIVIAVMMFIAVALVLMVCFYNLRRNNMRAERLPLPPLQMPTQGVYYNPINHVGRPVYDLVDINVNNVKTVNYSQVNDGQTTTDDERRQTTVSNTNSNNFGTMDHKCVHT